MERYLPEPLCRIRRDAKQATLKHPGSGVILGDKRRFFREFLADAGKHAAFHEKVLWDMRMAVTVYRTMHAGHAVRPQDVEEVFFRRLFPGLVYPVASNFWRLMNRDS